MFKHGINARIWARGGSTDIPDHSILGPTMATELPLIKAVSSDSGGKGQQRPAFRARKR